jgi:hypothetical protein
MASDPSIMPEPTPNGSAAAATAAPAGLPPVHPPSGKFIVQLFLVPGLIVALIVGVLLLFTWLFGGPRTPEQFLKKLDEGNPDVRWRTASDLAQTLRRDEKLASDPNFALQLAVRLRRTLNANRTTEADLAQGKFGEEEARKQRKALEADRNYENFLCACLGNFIVPSGGPLLKEVAEGRAGKDEIEMEPQARALLRRQAVWGLANLGENLKRFDALPEPDQITILARLEEAAKPTDAQGNDKVGEAKELADWAAEALHHLRNRREKKPDAFGVDVTLEKCAEADDPVLRYFAAFAGNFWSGTPEENARIEATLLKLAHDPGRGEEEAEKWAEADPSADKVLCRNPGLDVRINATIALARRGSPKTPVGNLGDMLDADTLRRAFILKRRDGGEQPHETKVAKVIEDTLKAVEKLLEQQPDYDLSPLRQTIDRLAGSDKKEIREEAIKVKQMKGW